MEQLDEILNSRKWVKVERYVEDKDASWEEKYKKLWDHHLEECAFLVDKVREFAKEALKEKK